MTTEGPSASAPAAIASMTASAAGVTTISFPVVATSSLRRRCFCRLSPPPPPGLASVSPPRCCCFRRRCQGCRRQHLCKAPPSEELPRPPTALLLGQSGLVGRRGVGNSRKTDNTASRRLRECWRGETSFWGAKPFVPSEFLGEKVLGEEVSRFFSVRTKVPLKMFLPAAKCYSRM